MKPSDFQVARQLFSYGIPASGSMTSGNDIFQLSTESIPSKSGCLNIDSLSFVERIIKDLMAIPEGGGVFPLQFLEYLGEMILIGKTEVSGNFLECHRG